MGMYDFEPEETIIPIAFQRKYGDCRIPTNLDVAAWKENRLSADPRDRYIDVNGDPLPGYSPATAGPKDVHPVTLHWTAPWKPKPTGQGPAAMLRTQLRSNDPSSREIQRKGGLVRSEAKREAARANLKKRKRPRAEAWGRGR
jgi:hypothetical protein